MTAANPTRTGISTPSRTSARSTGGRRRASSPARSNHPSLFFRTKERKVYALDTTAPLDPRTLLWDMRPAPNDRRRSGVLAHKEHQDERARRKLERPAFPCPACTLFTFDVACSSPGKEKGAECGMSFVQSNRDTRLGDPLRFCTSAAYLRGTRHRLQSVLPLRGRSLSLLIPYTSLHRRSPPAFLHLTRADSAAFASTFAHCGASMCICIHIRARRALLSIISLCDAHTDALNHKDSTSCSTPPCLCILFPDTVDVYGGVGSSAHTIDALESPSRKHR
ncbi:hypothetical protein FB451DRAFT_1512405 [Mycena latifolia]|nr:hypothetical protein FB451DRAFT_1512405 [Mycena latifolia]